jgi:hypothetical protein
MTPFGLLAPGAALFLFVRRRAVWLLHATLVIAFVGSVLGASFYTDGMRDLASSWAAFFALALCIGAIVASDVSATTPFHVIKLFSGVISATLEERSAAITSKSPLVPNEPGLASDNMASDLERNGWYRVWLHRPHSCTWGFLLRPISWAADSLKRSRSSLE